ncbi:MAG: polysaccharide pyruvyl transferase family protein [Immundisolibacter sp.]
MKHPVTPVKGEAVASSSLLAQLRELGNGQLWVIRLQGNFGDRLLWLGLENLLRHSGLPFKVTAHDQIDRIRPKPEDTVYIHGGGDWVPFWHGAPARVLQTLVALHRGPIVIGPSSFTTRPEHLDRTLVAPLRRAVGHVTVFCRERPSYEAVAETVGDLARVALDHDTALNLTRQDLLDLGEPVGRTGRYPLYGLRSDVERRPTGPCRTLRMPVDPTKYCTSFEDWVRLHAGAESIVTNRLHSAVCGAILGLPTTLLPNSYHKSRGVWEHSLRQRGVQWAETLAPDWLGQVEERMGISRYWRQSRKLQRLVAPLRFGPRRS